MRFQHPDEIDASRGESPPPHPPPHPGKTLWHQRQTGPSCRVRGFSPPCPGCLSHRLLPGALPFLVSPLLLPGTFSTCSPPFLSPSCPSPVQLRAGSVWSLCPCIWRRPLPDHNCPLPGRTLARCPALMFTFSHAPSRLTCRVSGDANSCLN